jgi:hypothetical protein
MFHVKHPLGLPMSLPDTGSGRGETQVLTTMCRKAIGSPWACLAWTPSNIALVWAMTAVIRQDPDLTSTPATFEGSKEFPRDDHLHL